MELIVIFLLGLFYLQQIKFFNSIFLFKSLATSTSLRPGHQETIIGHLQSVQGRRAVDPLHQQHPGETGHTSGGQAGGRNHTSSQGTTAGIML